MTEILITLFRFSVIVLALAAKGNPGGIVQQQIETMGLRQWLSLVSLWLVESVYAEIATVHDFSAAAFRQKPVKIAAPTTPIYLFWAASRADSGREWVVSTVRRKRLHSLCVYCLKSCS